MNHETSLRTNLAKIYVLLSRSEIDQERLEFANLKMAEVVGILDRTIPIPDPKMEKVSA